MSQLLPRKYAKPTVDVIFKKVFGNPANIECLKSFLTALLQIEFESLEIRNSEPIKEEMGKKGVRLDILAELPGKQFVNIEVQVKDEKDTEKRSLYYWSRLFSAQLAAGELYHEVIPVISIFILGFSRLKDSSKHLHKFVIKEQDTHQRFNLEKDLLEIHFLELPKFKAPAGVPTKTLDKWCMYLQTENDAVLEDLKVSDKDIFKAVSELELASMSPLDRRSYEARLAAIRDYNSDIYHSRNEGREEGSHQGKLSMFIRQAEKRFPQAAAKHRAKIFMLSDEQLDHQILMILDYPNEEAFDAAMTVLKAER